MKPLTQVRDNNGKSVPENLLPSLKTIDFVCPLCRGELNVLKNGYECHICSKQYLLHDGIPDFRVFSDPFLTDEEDYERTEIVLSKLNELNLEKLLEYYWSFSDITPVSLRPKFIRNAVLGEQRAARSLEILEEKISGQTKKVRRVLEIGAGTGNFLAVSAGRFEQVIGIDIAMRWLHVSRRRFMDLGLPVPPLVCCCAEFLPFADNSFDLVALSSTLEFVDDQPQVLAECARTLDNSGILYVNTVNRYSLARDPYSYLWGVGFLPRKWQPRYVKLRKSAVYKVRTLSYQEFNKLTKPKFPVREFVLSDVSSDSLAQFSLFTRFQIYIYRFFKKLPLFKELFKQVGPGWDVILRK